MSTPPDPPPTDSTVRRASSCFMTVLQSVIGVLNAIWSGFEMIPANEKSPECTPFPFLLLPWVAQRQVIHSMSITDYVKFALASPDLYKVAASVKRKLERVEWSFDEEYSRIRLMVEWCRNEYELFFPSPDKFDELREEFCIGRKEFSIQGIKVFLSTREPRSYMDEDMVDYVEATEERRSMVMEAFTKHILGLFRIEEQEVHSLQVKDCWLLDHTTKFSEVWIENEGNGAPWSAEEFQRFEDTVNCDCLFLLTSLPRDHAYSHPLRTKEIQMSHAGWLNIDAILYSTSSCIVIYEESLSDLGLNVVLREWIGGGLRNLQDLTIKMTWRLRDPNILFNGVQCVPADKSARPDYYFNKKNELEDTDGRDAEYDIETDDGQLKASVSIGDGQFVFFVWHPTYFREQG